ncbi:hypothetical protein F5Y18DRAFT_441659 [Xylariaceae sp. FL1019]|nr:hypothetical protein F5Y18DRAFT_441659 [Xylariaceae sp. FL1019]
MADTNSLNVNDVNDADNIHDDHHPTLPWLPTEDEVIRMAIIEKELDSTRLMTESKWGFRMDSPSRSAPPIWVKYKYNPVLLRCEANTQRYVHQELAKADEETKARFRVPEVYHFFEAEFDGTEYGLILMEYLPGLSVRELLFPFLSREVASSDERIPLYKGKAVDAICFILSLRAPPDAAPGPVGGGLIWHRAFGVDDPYPEFVFESLEDLQDYINEAREQDEPDSPPADFLSEGLRLCCGDLGLQNFILEDASNPLSSRVIIIDFEYTNWLPHSFQVWESWRYGDVHLSEGIRLKGPCPINEDNVMAIDVMHRRRARIEREARNRYLNRHHTHDPYNDAAEC